MHELKAVGNSGSINKTKAKNCERNIFCDSPQLPLTDYNDHKYFEIVEFKGSSNVNFALCIGLNPKWGREKQFDRSNQKIAGYLFNNYKGFILFNMFSIVTPDMGALKQYICTKPDDLQNDMRDVVSFVVRATACDIYLFYGENAYCYVANTSLSDALKQSYHQKRNIYVSESNGHFVHVGSQKCGSRMHAWFVQYDKQSHKNVF